VWAGVYVGLFGTPADETDEEDDATEGRDGA
jgi:hypothetical protein